MKTLVNQVIKNYLASLDNAVELKKTELKAYDVILETAGKSKKYRPTLYDFLAHRAADFFMNDESSVIQPAYRFEIDSDAYFGGPASFSKLSAETKDSLSLKFYAFRILQDLIAFHLNDKDPTALIDVDLERLEFIRQNSILTDKDSLYLKAVRQVEKSYIKDTASADAGYLIARELSKFGSQYAPLVSDQYKWEKKKAVEKCVEVEGRFPDSDGAKNCKYLQSQIKTPELNLKTEAVNTPNKPFLLSVGYRNINKLYFRVIQMDYETDRDLQLRTNDKTNVLKKYASLPVLKSWEQYFPNDGDFQNHRTEIKIPALHSGYFIVLASVSENFDTEKDLMTYSSLWISNISYISQKTPKEGYRFYLLDRESGEPLKGVSSQMMFREYDYSSREYRYNTGNTYTADENGYFEIPAGDSKSRPNSFYMDFRMKNDRLVTDNQYYLTSYYPKEEKHETRTWFFTDRSIYRPGQTIYFKGIVIDKFKDNYEIKANYKTTVEFFDVNYQKISELQLVTNEYGSFNATFTAPSGVLNGAMTIKNESGSASVSVEEYKRPKFEVVFNPVEGSYKLNEKVTVSGKAKAYAGNNIDNAQVKYRVERGMEFPWRYWYSIYFPFKPQMEITQGTTTTDANGDFDVEFKAIPDYSVPKNYQPAFIYTVYADVTDINGETQSSATVVRVGYKALLVNLEMKDVIDQTNFKDFKITTTNLNGHPEPAQGQVVISKLKEPDRLITKRRWDEPDVFVIDEPEFKKDFPNEPYKNEGTPEKLETDKVVSTLNFNTTTDSIIRLPQDVKLETGRYSFAVQTTDSFGEKVEFKKFVTLYAEPDKKIPVNEIFWSQALKDKAEPGEKAAFLIGTADKNVQALYEVVFKDEVINRQWLKLSNEQKRIEIPIKEEYRGGISVNFIFVKHNQNFQESFRVDVPYTNKKLDFEFMTFRNKLIPGQKEEWKIKIKGSTGEAVAAELLASMYDASLDALKPHSFTFDLYQRMYGNINWSGREAFTIKNFRIITPSSGDIYKPVIKYYDHLNWFGFNYYGGGPLYRKGLADEGTVFEMQAMPGENIVNLKESTESKDTDKTIEEGKSKVAEEPKKEAYTGLQLRRDFRETAFFYPTLQTNESGEVIISFTAPESLTRWKLLGLAHTKDLKYGQFEKEVITQKDLMVVPNPPRFLRQGDKIVFTAKIVNLSDKVLNGDVKIQFFDARTMNDITAKLISETSTKSFNATKGNSSSTGWELTIPDNVDVITYRIMAQAGNFSDGEENTIPVLTNRMLVTESMPLPVKGKETKNFTFTKLLNSGSSGKTAGTLKNYKLTLEFSSNPTWYAVQALPYIMESEYESADNTFDRYYANAIASFLVNSKPKIKQVFEVWKNYTPDALLSNLEKNQDLKSVILQETPWVMDAKNEKERKQRVALLFDLNRMHDELQSSLLKLRQKQSSNGGWPWFQGMPESRYMTQNIVTGFGHLKQLGVVDPMHDKETAQMMSLAVRYLDQRLKEDYDKIKKYSPDKMDENHLSQIQIQYLYARSNFMNDVDLSAANREAFDYFKGQAIKYWTENSIYLKGMIALALNRLGEKTIPSEIMASIKEHALYSDELGMYWRENKGGYYWYQAPVETQALLIEAFGEIKNDRKSVEQMKIWLLKQKQTQNWRTGPATAEAVYALLLQGSDWLSEDQLAEIKVGNEIIDPFKRDDSKVEAGTGYFRTSWSDGDIKPEMGKISVTNKNEGIAWGAVYWQYFENLDKITSHETPLKLDKKLFVERNTDAGPVIEPVKNGMKLKVGDKIKVRIELRVDRDMEYIHMKDLRASAFEPVNVISGYKYQGGLGYYESTLDASTNFYFDYLQKGTYVFEYPLIVSQKGDFSNGITTIQCMYAPEFTSHSEGVRVVVE